MLKSQTPKILVADVPAGKRLAGTSVVWRSGLRFKLVALVMGIALLSTLLSTLLFVTIQRNQIINHTRNGAHTVSTSLRSGLQHAFLNNDFVMASSILKAAVEGGIINSARIVNAQGEVAISTIPGDAGAQLSQSDPKCQLCHGPGRSGTQASSALPGAGSHSSVIYPPRSANQILLDVNVIKNSSECFTCHNPEQKVLGLLMIEAPLDSMRQQLTEGSHLSLLLGLATTLLLAGLILSALHRHVLKPVEALSRGMAQVSAGNLDEPVRVDSQDELGQLTQAFDSMRRQQKASLAEMTRRRQELAVLNEIGMAAVQLLELQEILEFSLDSVISRLGMEVGVIFLREGDTDRFVLRASRNLSPEQIAELNRRRNISGWDISSQVGQTGREVYVATMASDPRFHRLWDHLTSRSYINVPLVARSAVVGTLVLITPAGASIAFDQVDFLKAVGREIGIAIDNAMLLASARRSEQEALALYNQGARISASLALREVLHAVAEAAKELCSADLSLVELFHENQYEVIVEAVNGNQTGLLKGQHLQLNQVREAARLLEGSPLLMEDIDPEQPVLHDPAILAAEGIQSIMAIPLMRAGRFKGMIEVMFRTPQRFSPDAATPLIRLANQVLVSIENAQLYRQLRFLATLEERDRLAREMHDNLAQTLGYLNVKATMTEDLLHEEQYPRATESLGELKKVLKLAYMDVRESIFNLRTTLSPRVSLPEILNDYISEYRTHYGVDVRLIVETEECDGFTPDAATQLLRIVQEGLSNVRKHSGATSAWVVLQHETDCLSLSIQDQGAGFDMHEAGEHPQSYGLQIMRERAESIGGKLELFSQPGQGTRVTVRVPLVEEDF